MAIRHGASAVGLVSDMPSGPGVIHEKVITEIARTVPPGIATFLLTSATNPVQIVAQQRHCMTSVIQLCDWLPMDAYPLLRESLPGIGLVQVVHITGPEALDEALAVAPHVDALLLDSGNRSLPVKELGGTGRTHDWSVSAQIVTQCGVPVYLAGGLAPENIAKAIKKVMPFAVDVCSGVRTDGMLDEAKLAAFVEAVGG